MARPSTIDRLPASLREEIGRLRERGRTIDEILDHLRRLDPDADISRSALARHTQKLDRIGAQLRQSRALAEGLARGLGDRPADAVTRANIELMQDAVFQLLQDAAMAPEGEEGDALRATVRSPKAAALLAETLERLVKASRGNVAFVESIEKRAAEAAQQAATQAVERVARERGLSAEMVGAIKAGIFGVRAT